MFQYLAIRQMLWTIINWPTMLVLGAIACFMFRAPKTLEPARGAVFLKQCMEQKFPNVKHYQQEHRDACMAYAIQKSEAEYAKEHAK
jgi:hypothetical protein